jgi:DNA-binding MarR family transcriptional regulator
MITPKGSRLLERARSAALGVEDDVLRGLSADERRELRELLQRALGDAPPQPAWQAAEED